MVTSLGREVPDYVEGYGKSVPFNGTLGVRPETRRHAPKVKAARPGDGKVVTSLEEVFRRIPIRDGMTLSFHHHFRDGDRVVNMVCAAAAKHPPVRGPRPVRVP